MKLNNLQPKNCVIPILNAPSFQSCSRLRPPRCALPTLLPEGEGFYIPLPPGEGQRVREQAGIVKLGMKLTSVSLKN